MVRDFAGCDRGTPASVVRRKVHAVRSKNIDRWLSGRQSIDFLLALSARWDQMKPKQPHGPPMTLGNTRELGAALC
jgi:hypothetical protein